MSRIPTSAIVAVLLAGFVGMAIAAQDKYSLKLGKLSFGDFRGYENWENVAVSQTEKQMKVILANDVMMKAYRKGLPADGKLFPEGSKIVKIEWSFKRNTVSPYFVNVPDALQAVDVIEKDSKRFPDTHGWAYGDFNYDAPPTRLRRREPIRIAATPATPRWRSKITFIRPIRSGESG